MSIGIRIQNTMGYCKFVAGCVGGAGLAVAYQMEAIGLALTAIGGIGCLWAIASSRNTSGERDLNSGRIVSNNREQIAAQASGLMIPDMDDRTRNAIIETVARIPVNERGQVIGLVSRYPQMCNTTNILQIISDIARIPANEREQVTHLVSRLIRPHMLSMSISAIFTEAASIPVNGREQVTHLVSRLIHPQMHGIGISFIIRSVASIPANEREQVINLVSRLIHPQMDSLQICLIIGTVANAGNERAGRMQRVLHQIQDLANGLENEAILHRMLVILETPLNQPIPPFCAGMAELAAQGHNAIDVHHGSRDAKTREAIELLRKHQGLLNPTRISAAVEEFKQYLNAYAGDSAIKNTAQQALHGPPENEDWAPLLNNAIYTIDNGRLSISGEELIARLWIFANEQSEKKEQENCRFGIIKALSDSIEHGRRVCPPGQTQRQIVAVLQGRLKGVNVDGVRKTTNELVAGLIVENKGAGRAQLIQAAGVFLDRNPDVDRDAFMIELNEYMRLMEL